MGCRFEGCIADCAVYAQGAVAVEGEAMLWKPSASSSLWDVRRLPSLPDMGTALNRSSSVEYEAAAASKAQELPAGRDDGAKGKPPVVAEQDFSLEPTSKGMLTSTRRLPAGLVLVVSSSC